MVTGQWGEDLLSGPTPVGPGYFVFSRYTYPVPTYINDVMFKVEHIRAVAFVTEGMYGEIINADECEVTYPLPPPVSITEILPRINDNIIYDIYGRRVTEIKENTIYIKNNKKFIRF